MWMENSSTLTERPGIECTSNNTLAAAVSSKPNSVPSIADPAFPRRFRFVSAGSRLRKRRKGRTRTAGNGRTQLPDQSGETVSLTSKEIFSRGAGEDQGRASDGQSGDGLQLTGGGKPIGIWHDEHYLIMVWLGNTLLTLLLARHRG